MNFDEALSPGFSVDKAHETQKLLSGLLICADKQPKNIKYVAGVDVAYSIKKAIGSVAVLDYPSMGFLESKTAVFETKFPYIPTLLSFREIPPAVACIKKLILQPDVFLVDGHGLAHPWRCGLASHLGLIIKKPTIGVAKTNLVGRSLRAAGDVSILHEGKIVGSEVQTKNGSKPVYVSIGHMISLESAIRIVRHCACVSRIPEPLRIAHIIASQGKPQ